MGKVNPLKFKTSIFVSISLLSGFGFTVNVAMPEVIHVVIYSLPNGKGFT